MDLVKLLASVLLKMTSSPHYPLDIKDSLYQRPFIRFSPEQWSWICPQKPLVLDWTSLPNRNTKNFILVKDLGGQGDGRVYLACSEQGNIVVLKFRKTDAMVEEEFDNWERIYPTQARIVTLNHRSVLLMPYIEPLGVQEWKELSDGDDKLLKTCLKRLASLGIYHDDLSWRHVGKRDGQLMLYDLARIKTDQDQEKAFQAMINISHPQAQRVLFF
jgi:hypothetical protein